VDVTFADEIFVISRSLPITGLLGVLVIDDDMNDLIAEGASIADLRATAAEKGFQSLADDGVRKVLLGEVSPGELARAVDLAARL